MVASYLPIILFISKATSVVAAYIHPLLFVRPLSPHNVPNQNSSSGSIPMYLVENDSLGPSTHIKTSHQCFLSHSDRHRHGPSYGHLPQSTHALDYNPSLTLSFSHPQTTMQRAK